MTYKILYCSGIVAFVFILTGCALMPFYEPPPHLRSEDVEQLFTHAIEHDLLHVTDTWETGFLSCDAIESGSCFFIDAQQFPDWDGGYQPELINFDNIVNALFRTYVMSSIGVDRIKTARNFHVGIRCQRSITAPEQVECAINYGRGNGWELLAVE